MLPSEVFMAARDAHVDIGRIDAELGELSRQVNEKATGQAGELAKKLENQKAALRAKAEGKLDAAAAIVVERIVNS